MDKLTPEQTEIANAADLMFYHLRGKSPLTTISKNKDLVMFNAVSQNVGHELIHLLSEKCLFDQPLEIDMRVKLGQQLVTMFFLGVYMAEHGMAKLGTPEKIDPVELQ